MVLSPKLRGRLQDADQITVRQLRSIVGRDACARILSELETSPDAIALRRTTASGRWINFHTDAAALTLQVMSGLVASL
jgi:hypothetical protein